MKSLPSVAIYLGNNKAIIAARHASGDGGFLYEQEIPVVLDHYAASELGAALKSALSQFSIREANLRNQTKTEWPAFRASGAKSVKSFEKDFIAISVSHLNSSGASARAEVALNEDGFVLSVAFNPLLSDGQVGERIFELARMYKDFSRSQQSSPR